MNRRERHRKILALVGVRPITSQFELSRSLRAKGISVTQATLSRDLRELGLVKTPQGYKPAESLNHFASRGNNHSPTTLQFVTDIAAAGNLVVVKTNPGSAHPVALSLDNIGWKDIVGTVAGDDTILVVTKNGPSARAVRKRLSQLVSR